MYEKLNDFDVTTQSCNSIKDRFKSLSSSISQKTCFLGFDGYIDSLYSLVQARESVSDWTKMESMKPFGEYIVNVAGSSANIERVLKRKIAGGFTANTCRAINSLGMDITLMAAIGYPQIQAIFTPLTSKESIEAIPIANSGETTGLEFNDGKIMLTDFENIFNINWTLLIERVGLETLTEKLENADIMGFGHWALVQELTNIWEHMLEEIFPSINLKNSLFFVDLADIKKRSKADILKMLRVLGNINDYLPVLLSLNDQEAIDVSKALDGVEVIDPTKKNHSDYVDAGKRINEKTDLSHLVIHSPHFATTTTREQEHFWVTEGFTATPRFTTAAGDHFNSGTAAGLSCGLNPAESILLGNALTAVFVRTGKSPNLNDLEKFMNVYLSYVENDNPNFSFQNDE